MKLIKICWVGVVAALVAGCGGILGGKKTAEAAADRVHELYNQNQMETIWQEAGGELHQDSTKQKQQEHLAAVRRKLGRATTSTTRNWKVFQNNLKTTVHLTRETAFERGHGTEEFVFLIAGTNAVMTSYHLDSK